ncbi:glycosyltransferase family 2 protein [Methanosphaera sp. ISO3-F5]|uniref:glycosyltransferase family 2 protein n=1 Tax=Methanosphaera sp. ISO3-F5 TaxID=1452353 RepID=UPI002B25D716|nr:glycosyltransferase family 2 protein [Methanosphaera sp. ISO3-F5]WQH63399.1 glycosyltransferase family 2 protein [Methanosphaera sp. ISO3-F5]
MIEDKLELVLVTYNRALYLENTLKQFLDSPFRDCKFTVIDNCSPDNTRDVCAKYSKLFPNMSIIRNNLNIGGNANITQGLRTSSLEYTWLLADDDSYDFSDCNDVIEAVDSSTYDFVHVSSPLLPSNKKEGQNKDLTEIIEEFNPKREIHAVDLVNIIEGKYFMDLAFISSYIFRTELLESDDIIRAYDNIPNFFPQMSLISKSVNKNFFIYRAKHDLIIQGDNPENDAEHTYTFTKFYEGWLHSGLMINDKNIRKIFYTHLDNHSLPTNNYLVVLPVAIMTDKALDKKDVKINVISLLAALYKHTGWIKGFLLSIYLLLIYIVPSSVYKLLYKKFY